MSENRIISSFSVTFGLSPKAIAAAPTPLSAPIISPCIGICTLDEALVCVGCKRSAEMITRWSSLSADERQSIMAALDEIESDH